MKIGSGKKVLVAMSGGVDSSVTAALLAQQGYEVVGCFMRLGSDDRVESGDQACVTDTAKPGHQGCCSVNDASDARLVAAMLDVPFYVLNFRRDFDRVINYFVDEYNAGRTPNPCVRCNDWLKFDKLVAYGKSIDADYIATGHYARIEQSAAGVRLLCGRDRNKDQSYFLFGIQRQCLKQMLLPIGDMDKSKVRGLAEQLGLPVYNKPDSQEICFVPDNNYVELIKRRTPERVVAGDVLDTHGRVVGQHEGQQQFTIGQRRGVAVALGYPVYVVDKDPDANTITVGPKDHLWAAGLWADQTNWFVDTPLNQTLDCQVKIRHNSPAVPAQVITTDGEAIEVRFQQPQRAVTPGQAVVCYVGEQVIGGGWISKTVPCQEHAGCV